MVLDLSSVFLPGDPTKLPCIQFPPHVLMMVGLRDANCQYDPVSFYDLNLGLHYLSPKFLITLSFPCEINVNIYHR